MARKKTRPPEGRTPAAADSGHVLPTSAGCTTENRTAASDDLLAEFAAAILVLGRRVVVDLIETGRLPAEWQIGTGSKKVRGMAQRSLDLIEAMRKAAEAAQ